MELSEYKQLQLRAVMDMQHKHWQLLNGSSVISKLDSQAVTAHDIDMLPKYIPIVLGSEYNDVEQVFIAYRDPSTPQKMGVIRSRYFTVGTLTQEVALPNQKLGITDDEFNFVYNLFSEAKHLQQTVAPAYSLESGLLR